MAKRRKSLFKTRRSKKIAPGTRITLTKKGLGMSVKTPIGTYSTRTGKITKKRKKGCCPLLAFLILSGLGLVLASADLLIGQLIF